MAELKGGFQLRLIQQEEEQAAPEIQRRKGRDAELLEQQRELILTRFVYYGRKNRYTYDYILSMLEKEFFLKAMTLGDIVQQNSQKLADIRREKLTLRQLKKKWGWIVWEP